MSTILQVQLVAPTQLAAVDTAYYTVPLNYTVKIGRAVFFNADTAPHTITINLSSGASTAANQVISRAISPGESYVSPELAGQVLPQGWSIRGLCDTALKVNLTASGITIVG
jgi:hypothetical protein